MKLFGIILLTGYFLAREKKNLAQPNESLKELLRVWAIYLLCAGLTFFIGIFLDAPGQGLNPLILFLAGTLPVVIFQGRPVCMIAGTATAFCVLSLMPDVSRAVLVLVWVEGMVLVTAFLYRGARVRMANLYLPVPTQNTPGWLLVLFSAALLLAAIYQKAVQLF